MSIKDLDLSKFELTPEEYSEVEKILRELSTKGDSHAYRQLMSLYYEEVPVSFERFITDPDYLGKSCTEEGGVPGSAMYPYWREVCTNLMHGGRRYLEVIFAGAIGLGKSWVACVCGCYALYKLLCLRNPQSFYKLAPNEPIVFLFINIFKYVSLDVAYGKFQRMLQNSPWFLRHGEVRGTKNHEYYPSKGIEFSVGANNDAAIGKNIFWCLLDEVSFAKGANPDMMKSGMMEIYRSIDARMISRFTIGGVLHAQKFLISSKRTDSDFLDQYAQSKIGDPNTFIVDEPQWVVKPKGTYSNRTFRLAVGSKSKKSIILEEDDKRSDSELMGLGYTQVIHPPIDLRPKFEFDMDASLRDLAGISTTVFTKFISYDKLSKCYSRKFMNPFTNSTPTIGLNDESQLWDYFDLNLVPEWLKSLPGFIHLDIAYSGDGYGIGYVAAAGMKTQFKDHIGEQATDPVYIHVFSASIKSPKGDQVSLEKVRQFIYWLKFNQGFNIRSVSTDGFMSVDTRQLLIIRGIDAVLLSLDRKPDGYLALKNAIYEKRTNVLEDELLETELIHLERNEMTGKIDHPLNGCFTGDTEIILLSSDGSSINVSLEVLTDKYDSYKDYRVLSYDNTIKPAKFKSPRITKYVNRLLGVELSNGKLVKCTDDHRFMLSTGKYCEAKNLEVGVKLMGNAELNITSITPIQFKDLIPVYDIEVPEFHNFVLTAGPVVHNSKDMSDGLAGALWNASLHQEEFSMIPNSIDAILKVNEDPLGIEDRTTKDLEDQLSGVVRTKEVGGSSNVITDDDDIDSVIEKVRGVTDEGKLSDEQRYILESMGIFI